MVDHVIVKALKGIIIRSCTDVEQEAVLWFEILADGLEEPFVRIDLAIISLLHTEHEVYAMAPELLIFNAKVPCCHLKAVQDVTGDLFFWHFFIHNVFHLFHCVILVLVYIHEAFLKENLLVKEAFFAI